MNLCATFSRQSFPASSTRWLALFVLGVTAAFPRNPISPPQVCPADPSAKVGADGRLYVYCSVDVTPERYCSYTNGVLSTSDLRTWQWHPDIFVSAGKGDMLAANDALLYAPDTQYRDGKYYLYFSQPGRIATGVAVSKSPTGPFGEVSFLNLGKHLEIDPSTFIDDDGQAYHVWGQFTLKMAKLNRDLRTLDASSIRDNVLTEKEHHFHEGAYLTKRNGLYYMVFADLSRAGMPTCIGYATSKSPMGPYQYRGVIIDNDHCNPGNWNNHGSIVEFGGQWYVFYHRSTQGVVMMRKACVEPIRFLPDGTIPEVEMTTQGTDGPLDSTLRIEAEEACTLLGNVRISPGPAGGELLSDLRAGDRATYKYLNFKTPPTKLRLRVKPGHADAVISVHQDQVWHRAIAKASIKGTPDGQWCEIVCDAVPVNGIHAVVLSFQGPGVGNLLVDWWRFE